MEEWDLGNWQDREGGDLAGGFCLEQRFSSSVNSPSGAHSEMSGDVFGCHTAGATVNRPGLFLNKHPQCIGQPTTTKKYPVQNVSSAETGTST